jgi:hypothetical protein
MPSRNVEWNPFNPSLFATFDNKKIKLCQVSVAENQREASILKVNDTVVSCMNWCQSISKSQLISLGTATGAVVLLNWDSGEEVCIN